MNQPLLCFNTRNAGSHVMISSPPWTSYVHWLLPNTATSYTTAFQNIHIDTQQTVISLYTHAHLEWLSRITNGPLYHNVASVYVYFADFIGVFNLGKGLCVCFFKLTRKLVYLEFDFTLSLPGCFLSWLRSLKDPSLEESRLTICYKVIWLRQ